MKSAVPNWLRRRTSHELSRPFYSWVLTCQAFDLEWGWRWPCCDRDQYLVSMITKSLTYEKQQRLYHNKVKLSLTPFQGLGNRARNCKMDYSLNLIRLGWSTASELGLNWALTQESKGVTADRQNVLIRILTDVKALRLLRLVSWCRCLTEDGCADYLNNYWKPRSFAFQPTGWRHILIAIGAFIINYYC